MRKGFWADEELTMNDIQHPIDTVQRWRAVGRKVIVSVDNYYEECILSVLALAYFAQDEAILVVDIPARSLTGVYDWLREKRTIGLIGRYAETMWPGYWRGVIPWPLPNVCLLLHFPVSERRDEYIFDKMNKFVSMPAAYRALKFGQDSAVFDFNSYVWKNEYVPHEIQPYDNDASVVNMRPDPVKQIHWLVGGFGISPACKDFLCDQAVNNGLPLFLCGDNYSKSYPPEFGRVDTMDNAVTKKEVEENTGRHWRGIRLRVKPEAFWQLFEADAVDAVTQKLAEPMEAEEFARLEPGQLKQMMEWFEPGTFRNLLRNVPFGMVWDRIDQQPDFAAMRTIICG
jgi:hypothetical protein